MPTPTPPAPQCVGGGPVSALRLSLLRILPPAGDDRLTLTGEVSVGAVTPAVDPLANGLSFTLFDADGLPLVSRAIPGGAAPTRLDPGWRASPDGSTWTYQDRLGLAVPGVIKVSVKARVVGPDPSVFSFKVTGKDGDFGVAPDRIPMRLDVALGGSAEFAAGQCGSIEFNPPATTRPYCEARAPGNTVLCR